MSKCFPQLVTCRRVTALEDIYIYIVGDIYSYIVGDIYRYIVGDNYSYIIKIFTDA